VAPITHLELKAACENLQISPTPDEVRLIMAASREYVSWYNKSSNPAQRDPAKSSAPEDQAAFSDELDAWFDKHFP